MLPFESSDRLNRAIGATYRFQPAVCFFKLQAASSSAGAGNKSHHEDRAPHLINHPLPRRFTTSASASSFRFQSHSTFTHSAQVAQSSSSSSWRTFLSLDMVLKVNTNISWPVDKIPVLRQPHHPSGHTLGCSSSIFQAPNFELGVIGPQTHQIRNERY